MLKTRAHVHIRRSVRRFDEERSFLFGSVSLTVYVGWSVYSFYPNSGNTERMIDEFVLQ